MAALLLAMALPVAAAPSQDAAKISGTAVRAIEDLAKELVRSGRTAEFEAVMQRLPELAVDPKTVAQMRTKLGKEKRGQTDDKKDQALGQRARKVAAALAADLPRQTSDAARKILARTVLAFDDQVEAAQTALGRTASDDGWLDTAGQSRAKARREFAAAVAAARALEFEIKTEASTLPIVTAQVQDRGGAAFHRGFQVHVYESQGFARSSMLLALRTCALLAWIRTGKFDCEVPTSPPFVMVPSRTRYEAAADDAKKRGTLPAEDLEKAKATTLFHDGRTAVYLLGRDEMVANWLLRQLAPSSTGALDEGALNLCCEFVVGCHLHHLAQTGKNRTMDTAWYTASAANENTYYAYASSLGVRRFLLRAGAEARIDLPRLFAVPPTEIAGLPHLQATAACAYAIELGIAPALFTAAQSRGKNQTWAAIVDAQFGAAAQPAAIADWLAGDEVGLTQQLAIPDEQMQVRRAVDAVRKQALGNVPHKLHAVAIWNPALERGCAAWLRQRQGGPTTAAGAEAATQGVAQAGADVGAALRAMLTSVAMRTALLDPGTVEIGAAFGNGELAVDTGSMRHAVMTDCSVVWPNHESSGVPTGYLAGMPVPEPGLDAAALGYPLTITLGLPEGEAPRSIGMRLTIAGTEEVVTCYRFDPARPLPGCDHLLRTYGLIPKAPLKPKTKYLFMVQADGRDYMRSVFTTN